MKNKTTLICFGAFISFLFLTFSRCSQTPIDVAKEISKANEGFMAAYNSGDTKTLAANYTGNAKLYPSNSGVIEGTNAIEGFWSAVMKMGIRKASLETVTAQQTGNIAIEEGQYKLFVEGDVMVDQGKYLVTWEKVDGQWKITRDIWNTNNPAPTIRAGKDGGVWLIANYIKAEKAQQFEDFNMNYLKPAGDEFFPELSKSVRLLKPNKPNQDGTYTYFYLMDPVMKNADYQMEPILTAKFGREKGEEYHKMYLDCLKKSEAFETTQTGW